MTVAAFGNVTRKGQVALFSLIVLGVLMVGFASSRNLTLSCVLLLFASAALMSLFSMISSLVQLIVPDNMRGRVMSVYNVAFRGGMPIGSLLFGAIVPNFGVAHVLAGNGVAMVLLGLYFLFVQRRVARL